MDTEMQHVQPAGPLQDFHIKMLPGVSQQGSLLVDNEFLGFGDDEIDDDEVDVSDADSDDFQAEQDAAKREAEITAFRATMRRRHSSDDEDRNAPVSNKRKPKRRGPRQAVEPSAEIKVQLNQASTAIMADRLDDAQAIIEEVIRLNAETYEAWMMLSSIFQERDEMSSAIMTMFIAAHLRPRDFNSWMGCAQFAVDDSQGDREKNLRTAFSCYSAAVRANPKSVKARARKANVAQELGNASLAATEYLKVLKRRPYDMPVLRHLAEAAFDSHRPVKNIEATIVAYDHCIAHVRAGGTMVKGSFEWSDVLMYVEMWAFLDRYDKAATSLRLLSRMLVGRHEEDFWDRYEDDREWDIDDERRREVPEYNADTAYNALYGRALQLDLRAKLAIYRLRQEQDEEAQRHLDVMDPGNQEVMQFFYDSHFVVKDLANHLMESRKITNALQYYNLYRKLSGQPEADILVQQGKCYLGMEDQATAEECFIAAIELDDHNIDARYELAQMYEGAQEKEEAFILVNEALQLEHDLAAAGGQDVQSTRRQKRAKKPPKEKKPRKQRIHVRKMGGKVKRQMYEDTVSENFKAKYQRVQVLREKIKGGHKEAEVEWMAAAENLVDDFRSFKAFYPWDSYLKFLGYGTFFQGGPVTNGNKEKDKEDGQDEEEEQPQHNPQLAAMAERLHYNLAPEETDGSGPALRINEHRGIPFDAWLDLFLEYAVALAHRQQAQDAYLVCQSARDSIVYKSSDNMFLIHVAWAACAVYAADEETCVAVARFFMRNQQTATDSYRMFSALCRVCQSPVSWYSSGPAQKYMLRQVKAMDKAVIPEGVTTGLDRIVLQEGPRHEALDVALLMLYGHILLTSTSYTYALNYFLRAASIDPTNPMVNLSVGLAYMHYSMKRQAEQRQHILTQGLHYLFLYYDSRMQSNDIMERLEGHYNIGRTYHLLGIYHLAAEYFGRVLTEAREHQLTDEDFVLEAAVNMRTLSLINGDYETARVVADTWLVI